MSKFFTLLMSMLVLSLAAGLIGCDNDSSDPVSAQPTPTPGNFFSITWNNEANVTVDFFLDDDLAERVPAGQSAVTPGVSRGQHQVHACPEGFEPNDGCEGELIDIQGNITYTIRN